MTVDTMRPLISIIITMLLSNIAYAQDGSECFSKFTKFNVCEKAREIQRQMASSLPMKMNSNYTISAISVAGPRLVFIAIWNIRKADVDASLAAGNMSIVDFQMRMNQATRNSVCSEDLTAAFIRLGGQIQYFYKTEDQFVVASPAVTAC